MILLCIQLLTIFYNTRTIWWFEKFRKHLTEEQISALMAYDYPGNVRELLNLLERAAVLEENDFGRLVAKHREMNAGLMGSDEPTKGGIIPDELEQVIKNHIKNVFYKYTQNLSRASAALKISRNTMRKYLEEARAEEA